MWAPCGYSPRKPPRRAVKDAVQDGGAGGGAVLRIARGGRPLRRGGRRRHYRASRGAPRGAVHRAAAHAAGAVHRGPGAGVRAVQPLQVPAHLHGVRGGRGAGRGPVRLLRGRRVRQAGGRALLQRLQRRGRRPGPPGAGRVRRQHGLPEAHRSRRRGRTRGAVRVPRPGPGVRLGQHDVLLVLQDDVGAAGRRGRGARQGVAQVPRALQVGAVDRDPAHARQLRRRLPRVPGVRGERLPDAGGVLGAHQGRHRHPAAQRRRLPRGHAARRPRALHGHDVAADHGAARGGRRHVHLRGEQQRGRRQGRRRRGHRHRHQERPAALGRPGPGQPRTQSFLSTTKTYKTTPAVSSAR